MSTFNTFMRDDREFERYTLNLEGKQFPTAGHDELQYLASPATTLIVVQTYNDNRDHHIDSATLPDEKVQLLLNARSNDHDCHTSVIMHFDTERYSIDSRREALSWLGIAPRPPREPARMVDADQNEYIDAAELTVTT